MIEPTDIGGVVYKESGVLPLRNSQLELFARKVCDGMSATDAYKFATGRSEIKNSSAQQAGKRWSKAAESRIDYIMNERAKSFVKAEDELKAYKDKAMRTRLNRPPVDVSTFEGRKQFFQDVCDDYQVEDGVDVGEAINAVKELMKIHGDFTRREDEVAKSDPAMVMAVFARAHLESPNSCLAVMDMLGAEKIANEIRKQFGLDFVHIISNKLGVDVMSKSDDVLKKEAPIPAPVSEETKPVMQKLLKATEL